MLLRVLIRALVEITLLLGVDWLTFVGLRRLLPATLARAWRVSLAVAYWALTAGFLAIAAAALARPGAEGLARWTLGALTLLYLPKTIFLMIAAGELVLRLPVSLAVLAIRDVSRRTLWRARVRRFRALSFVGAGLALVAFVSILASITLHRGAVAVERVAVQIAGLPAGLDGLRIVQLSDLHVDTLGRGVLPERVVTAVREASPEVIVLTGDYGTIEDARLGPDILRQLSAPLGAFAVLGNHDLGKLERASDNWVDFDDKRRKIEALRDFYRDRKVTLLLNSAVQLERGGVPFAIAGVEIADAHHGYADADAAKALAGCANVPFRILLNHNPQYWDEAIVGKQQAQLTLTGHTHGGQLGFRVARLRVSIAQLYYRRWEGLYRVDDQYLYVNRGVGFVGLPFRVNAPAEVTVIELRGAEPRPKKARARDDSRRQILAYHQIGHARGWLASSLGLERC